MGLQHIPNTIAPRIGALIRMLGSEQDGEALGACRALNRTLVGAGCSLHDLAAEITGEYPPQPQRPSAPPHARTTRPVDVATVLRAGTRSGIFSPWERRFAADIAEKLGREKRAPLSAKQAARVGELIAKASRSGCHL